MKQGRGNIPVRVGTGFGNPVPLQDRLSAAGTSTNPRTSNRYARVRNRRDRKKLDDQKDLDKELDGISRGIADRVEMDKEGMEVDKENPGAAWSEETMGPFIN